MLDFFGQTLCIGDRVAFVGNNNLLISGQIVEFRHEEPRRVAGIWTDGKRLTFKPSAQIVRQP